MSKYVLFVFDGDVSVHHIESDDGLYYIKDVDPMTGFNYTNNIDDAKVFSESGDAIKWGYSNTNEGFAKCLRYKRLPEKTLDKEGYVIRDLGSSYNKNYVINIDVDAERNPKLGSFDDAWVYFKPENANDWLRENGLYGKNYIVITRSSVLDRKNNIKERMGHSELDTVQQGMMKSICNAGDLLEGLCKDLSNNIRTDRKWVDDGTTYLRIGIMLLKRGVGRPKTF